MKDYCNGGGRVWGGQDNSTLFASSLSGWTGFSGWSSDTGWLISILSLSIYLLT
jgi:hypothetical protein